MKIISEIQEFYLSSKNIFLSKAAKGWFFSLSFDKYFLEKSPANLGKIKLKTGNKFESKKLASANCKTIDSKQIILKLNEELSYVRKFNLIKELLISKNPNLINDSFIYTQGNNLKYAQKLTFNAEELNIVIIGGGICGLFFANNLKSSLGSEVNILILDNRSDKKNIRKIFNREWLTHIPSKILQRFTSQNIKDLLGCFGQNGLTGLPINFLESILMLSCKEQGVNFFFSQEIDYSKLDNKLISFFVDASGGRFNLDKYSLNNTELKVQIPNARLNFKAAGINQLDNYTTAKQNHIDITLMSSNNLYYPYFENKTINSYMFKVIEIPIEIINSIFDSAVSLNSKNLFYIWKGNLREEVNKGLIIINLKKAEFNILINLIKSPIRINNLLKNNFELLKPINTDIIDLLKIISKLDIQNDAKVEKPFSYSPYINLNAGLGFFNNKNIFPIGDSLFCGHPKVGNGLGNHLAIANNLTEVILKEYKK